MQSREKSKEIAYQTINARFETLHEKASFRVPSDSGRCAVLMDGWFEWKEIEGRKFPHFIHRSDKKPFLVAGLWDRWEWENEVRETFSIVTTEALGVCALIHNTKMRMPLILDPLGQNIWLDPLSPFKEIKDEIKPDWQEMRAHSVSPLVGKRGVDKNIPAVREPVEPPFVQQQLF